tara:strand:- start:1521 stop:2309 length:789 start_codon:yes stop_codon:yes gene_type:complete
MHSTNSSGENKGIIYVKWGTDFVPRSFGLSSDNDHVIIGEQVGRSLDRLDFGDFNGDGIDDLLVVSKKSDGVDIESGKVYVIYGGDLTGSIDIRGYNSDDNLSGSTSDEVIFSDAGNDTVRTGGGADYVQAGGGNDIIYISDYDFKAIDGGPGFDWIGLENYSLDLSSPAVARFRNVEGFDLSSSGFAESLSLSRVAALKLNKKHQLYVKGATNDTLNISGPSASWSLDSTISYDGVNYNKYTNTKSNAVIFAQSGMIVNLP